MRNLNKLYWLKIEISQIEEQIKELTFFGGSSFNGMPGGNNISSPTERYVERKEKLIKKLNRKRNEFIKEQERIEEYIENIADDEIRVIARKRFLEHKKWEDIGEELFMDRKTASRKMQKYLEAHE